jgi:hypothetical protein
MNGYEKVIAALEERDLLRGGWGASKMALCPSHADERASLSLKEGDNGTALLYCHAGCPTAEVLSALDLAWGDLYMGSDKGAVVDWYVYTDEGGDPLYRKLRSSTKDFYQERYEDGEWKPGIRDTRRVLYGLPVVLAAVAAGEPVYLTEGEKDAENLGRHYGVTATTAGGASEWAPGYQESLRGASHVYLLPDGDEAGGAWASRVGDSLGVDDIPTTTLRGCAGKDATDHIMAGFSLEDFGVAAGGAEDAFEPWDWWDYETPDTEWLFEPYVPRASRVLVYGASGSLKSLWAAWLGAHLSTEGHRVGYFNLEMPKSMMAKRMRQLNADRANFKVFGKFMMGQQLGTAIKNFEGYSLLIVDSWSQAQGDLSSNDNDGISRLDAEFFQPLIAATGATVMLIDNTGKDVVTEGGKVKNDEARGASRKKDIQEVALWFDRPYQDDNFKTTLRCRKMRLDIPQPKDVTIWTPQDRIEFYLNKDGVNTETPMWPGMVVEPDTSSTASESAPDVVSVPAVGETPLPSADPAPEPRAPEPWTRLGIKRSEWYRMADEVREQLV